LIDKEAKEKEKEEEEDNKLQKFDFSIPEFKYNKDEN